MLRVWIRVLAGPSERVFAVERDKRNATLKRAMWWVVFGSVLVVLLGFGQGFLKDAMVVPLDEFERSGVPSRFELTVGQAIGHVRTWLIGSNVDIAHMYARIWLLSDFITDLGFKYFLPAIIFLTEREWLFDLKKVVARPLYFFLSAGVYYCLARALSGRGQFGRYVYLLALFSVPLQILIALLSFLPLVGPTLTEAPFGQHWYRLADFPIVYILSWLLSFYGICLAYLATKVEHGLSWWRVTIVVVVGYVVAHIMRNSLEYLSWGLMLVPQLSKGSGG